MRADYLTYRTATRVSLWGLFIQLILALLVMIYSIIYKDHAGLSTAIFLGCGVVVWLTLAILYDQHRRERIEAVEVEAASQSGGATSVFAARDELRPAQRRLAGLYKFLAPAAAILVAVLLVGLGIWRFLEYRDTVRDAVATTTYRSLLSIEPRWGLGLGIVMGVVGFVIARYAAGMAKHAVWSNLRAGAAHSVGAAILGLLLAVAYIAIELGPDLPARMLGFIVPGFMVLVGAETILNLMLLMYQPRRAGDTPRVAFDSRLLGFVAAPDRIAKSISDAINYQLGFDVTGGWFYRLISRTVLPLVLAGVGIVWVLSCLSVVQPHQAAIVLRWGKPIGKQLGPGLHFKLPWPIDRVYVPEFFSRGDGGRLVLEDRTVTGLRSLQLGTMPSTSKDPLLWTNDHAGEEVYQYVRSSRDEARTGELVDLAMVSVEIPLHYVVSDVRQFDEFAAPTQRDELIRSLAVREATRFFQTADLNDVLGSHREALSRKLLDRVQKVLDEQRAGVRVLSAGIAGVHPPKDTAPSFEARVQADQRRVANIQKAEADAVATLTKVVGDAKLADQIVAGIVEVERLQADPSSDSELEAARVRVQKLIESAGGEAASTLSRASADRWRRHMTVRADATRYGGQLAMWNASPYIFAATNYFDALTQRLKGTRVFLVQEDGGGSTHIRIEAQDKDRGVSAFDPGIPE